MNDFEELIKHWTEIMEGARNDADNAKTPIVKRTEMARFMTYRDCIKELRQVKSSLVITDEEICEKFPKYCSGENMKMALRREGAKWMREQFNQLKD